MEVLKDGRFNLIETDNLIVKNINSYTISVDTILTELSSGTLYLIDSTNRNISITLPTIKNGINYEFIFNTTNTNSITFKTNQNPLDNSKFIGTDWLYLKRTDILIEYSALSGSSLTFKSCQKGEYIKFYCDGSNYYIIEKNDTNNNVNNIITKYPNSTDFNYIVNINTTSVGYSYNIINELTNEPINTILMNTKYNFKFNTLSPEYNAITNITTTQKYDLYTYIDYYNELKYNFDSPESTVKYIYKYPVFNFKLKDSLNNEYTKLDLFNTTAEPGYFLNLNNNSIKYPGYLYSATINKDIDGSELLSKTSILNIDYNNLTDNLTIYNEFNSVIYNHNQDRYFLLANRDIEYTINYINQTYLGNTITYLCDINKTTNVLTNNISNTKVKFIFTSSADIKENFITNTIDSIYTLPNDLPTKLYYFYIKCTVNNIDKVFKIPILLLDQFIIQPQQNSYITIQDKVYNKLPINNNNVHYNYKFNIVSNDSLTILDNLDFTFLNTKQTASTIEENIFTLMKTNLSISVKKADVNDYLLKFMSTGSTTEYYTTTFSMSGSFKLVSLYIDYKTISGINISYYSTFNNIIGGNFKLNQFIIDDNYSGKTILLNLEKNISLNFNNNKEGNFYEFIVDNDNITDTNIYKLLKSKNTSSVDEYYFTKNNDSTNLLKTIDLYTSNKYEIIIDNSISLLEITRNTDKINDLIQFSDIKDGLINFKKTQNYNFISKKINTDNSVSLIIDLIQTETPTKIYYYNKNTRNIGGLINILSLDNRLNNVIFNSLYPFTTEYKYYINNVSYEKTSLQGVTNYMLTLKKLKKGDSLRIYFNNNTNIIRDFKFNDNDDSIIKYPDNIISNNNLTTKLIKNNTTNKYDITLYDSQLNAINNTNTAFKFIKNQTYTIEQKDISNYNLENTTTSNYYLKLNYINNKLTYSYYTDSSFSTTTNIQLYRGLKYNFKQYHRSNYNPDIDIDLNRIFKITLNKTTTGNNVFHINGMEKYIPKILLNTVYYFDISDVLPYNFRLSLYNDGLNNNTLTEYISTEVIYKTDSNNNIHLIKLKLLETNINTILYYYSGTTRNIGSSIDIIKSSVNYLLAIKENKLTHSTLSVDDFYLNKMSPSYEVIFKNNSTLEEKKSILFYKDLQIQHLKFKLNFDSTIINKLYTTTLSDIISTDTVIIYVKEVYKDNYPKLSYFEFYSNSNLSNTSKLQLPLTLLQNKKYKFIQVEYKLSIFKFFIFINEYTQNYATDTDGVINSDRFDNNILTYTTNEGFTLNTTNFMNSFIYYSGVHYSNPNLYSNDVTGVVNGDKLLINYKMLLISEKNIFLSDDYNKTEERINISGNLEDTYYELTQTNIGLKKLFQNDVSHFYLKNKFLTTEKSYQFNINHSTNVLSYKNDTEIFISSISNSKYDNYNSNYNRNINIHKNIQYRFTYIDTNSYTDYIIKYSTGHNNTLLDIANIKSIESNKKYDYLLIKNTTESITYTNNDTINNKLTDTNDVFTLKTFNGTSLLTNYFTIHYKPNTGSNDNSFVPGVYEYLITTHHDVTSFVIEGFTTHSKYETIQINMNDSVSNTTNTLTITPDATQIQYVNIILTEKNTINPTYPKNTYIYTLKILKDTLNKNIVNYGKLIINDLDTIENKTSDTYLSKPIQFNLSDTDNTLPNSDLLNTYTLELLFTEYFSGDTFKKTTSKKFVFNNNIFNNVISTDTVLDKNIISTNLYISDFRTIILDISNYSLIDENITFYLNETASNKVTNNIIYTGKCGENNSKIILNINPNINPILFYYSNCLYESKFKYNMKISTLNDLDYYTNSNFKANNTNIQLEKIYGVLNINIIPFLENTDDIYYNTSTNYNNINFDNCYFILYNSTKTYKGTIVCNKSKNINDAINYNYIMNLKFDDTFKLYEDINVTTDYTLKIFQFKGGKIITPNYLHFDTINTTTALTSTKTNNTVFSSTENYFVNNKIITSTLNNEYYLNFANSNNTTYNNNEKYYISSNNSEKYKTSANNDIINNNISLENNTLFKYDNSDIFSILDNDTNKNISNKLVTRLNNLTNFVDINNTTTKQINTPNEFEIIPKLYRTISLAGTDYYSMKLNVNSVDDIVLILKPYHSYTFKIHTNLLIKDTDKYYQIFSTKLSIVNINDTKILSITDTSEQNTLTVNIPYISDLYDSNNKLYFKFECEFTEQNNIINKLTQGYYVRTNIGDAFKSTTNKFIDYIPILVDKKSVINNIVEFKNSSYYINNYINKVNIYNNFTNIFDISNETTFDINIYNDTNNLPQTNIYKSKTLNKILIYSDKTIYSETVENKYKIISNKTNVLVYSNKSELDNISTNNDSEYIIFLNKKYDGNDSSNDYLNSNQQDYKLQYIGQPGYNGELIFNLNSIKDFNINTSNIAQNSLFIKNFTYFNNNKNTLTFNTLLFTKTNFTLFEPLKLKLQYQINNTQQYVDLPTNILSYSDNYFPGKSNSVITFQIPKDIDNDNIFNENIRITTIGLYSNTTNSNISDLNIKSDIFTLPQYNSTIFLDIKNNTIIKLPLPNYSLEYKFIVVNSTIDPITNKSYLVSFTTNSNIYGYIDESLNKNVELKYNKELIFKNIVKGNSFILTSNKDSYFLENISIERAINNISTVNYNKNLVYIPNKTIYSVDINVGQEEFILNQTNTLHPAKFNKHRKYIFSTQNLSTDYYDLIQLDLLNLTNIDTSDSLLLNNYTNLYSILSKNNITTALNNTLFSSYVSNNHIIKYNVTYDNSNTLFFNNSTTLPTIYSNYIYQFYQPLGFYILSNYDLSLVTKTPNILETDYVTIATDVFNISVRINDIIKVSIPSTEISLVTPITEGQNNNILQISGDNFKNLSTTTEVYFSEDIYFSNSQVNQNIPKTWTKIVSKNVLYKPAITGSSDGKIRFKGINFTITENSKINHLNSGNGDSKILTTNCSANTYFNSINYNVHKLMYIYYKPIIVNSLNNSIILNGKTYTLSLEYYKTYDYTISDGSLTTDLLVLLTNIISSDNYTLIIDNDRYKLSHTTTNFIITETNLSKLLGFNSSISQKNHYGNIPNINNIFHTDDYYKYYGKPLTLDYFTLETTDSNSTVSIDLEDDKHINLPKIVEGLTYTFIINNSVVNKKLFIHSTSSIYYINTNQNGNILVLKPNSTTKNLYTGTSITIACNNDKYFIIDIKGFDYSLNLYTTTLYNSNNNLCNLYYTETGLSKIDKYISIYGIHIVGLSDVTNKLVNEKKFIHVAKTLAKILDYNETKTIYDNNILNSILSKNSYIILHTDDILPNTISTNYFISSKHNNNIYIKYSDINILYDYTKNISETNKFDITLEKIIELLIHSYIYTYPHIFNYSSLKSNTSLLSIYKYISNTPISIIHTDNELFNTVYIEDKRVNKIDINIVNTYYNSSNISNTNYSVGTDITLRIDNLNITYTNLQISLITGTIKIINIGKGYKNNDKIKISIATNVNLILTLSTIDISNTANLYNIYNAHSELSGKTLNTYDINELINNVSDDINITVNGSITNDTTNTLHESSMNLNDVLYDKTLASNNDINKYVSKLLLSLLGFYRKRNIINEFMTKIDFNIITPTLVKQFNPIFVAVYFSTSLHNINNLSNIHSYNLDNINYIKSTDAELSNLQLSISDANKITDYNSLITTYPLVDTYIFDNKLEFTLTPNNQYATFNINASSIRDSVSTNLPIINETTSKPIVDISTVKSENYFDTKVKVNLNVTSESGIVKNYLVNLERTETKSAINILEKLFIHSGNKEIHKTSDLSENDIIYFTLGVENTLKIILKNIYSSISAITINNANKIGDNTNTLDKYSYSYVFTPDYYKSNSSFTIQPETDTPTKSYNFILQKLPNKIATLDDVIITNVTNINKFNKNKNYYSCILKNDVKFVLTEKIITNTDNISFHIKKTDPYSTVHTTMEYMDSNGDYIIFKETIGEFIDNILTLNKNAGSYKNTLINKNHEFYIDYPVVKWSDSLAGFELDVVNSNASDFTSDNNKAKIKNMTNEDDWAVDPKATELNNTFNNIDTTEYSLKINSTNNKIIQLCALGTPNTPINPATNVDNSNIANRIKLTIVSKIFKKINDDTEVINIQNISNIRVNINVIAEDKIVKNTYSYIIQI